MKYEVICRGKSCKFDNFDEALQYAKMITFEEEKFDTALIIERSDSDVKIQGLRWIIFNMYEVVNLTI